MTTQDPFRSPQLGDTIRPVRPTQTDTPMFPAGTNLRVTLSTQAAVDKAAEFVAARTWCVEPKGGEA